MPTRTNRSSEGQNGQTVTAVHDRLRAAILSGELEAGAAFSQAVLASDFGAGRTPLREALRLLQREGLVVAEPNRQVQIAPLSAEDFEDIYLMRIALETVAIRLTVPTLTSDDVAELEACMAKLDHYAKGGDVRRMRTPHRALHHRLVAAVGARGSREIAELTDHCERYRLAFGGIGDSDERRAEHRAIVDAAAAGDPDLAAERLAVHYARTAALAFAALDPDRDLGRLHATIRAVAPAAEAALPKR